jgi:hypothetical protein
LREAFFRQFGLSAINPVLQTYAKQIYGTLIFGRQEVEQGGTFCLIIALILTWLQRIYCTLSKRRSTVTEGGKLFLDFVNAVRWARLPGLLHSSAEASFPLPSRHLVHVLRRMPLPPF